MSATPYTLKSVKQAKGRYEELIPEWWNWVHTPGAVIGYQTISRLNVTFLRDDIIGNQRNIDAGFDTSAVTPFSKTFDVPGGTNIFIPVYHAHYTKKDPFPFGEGGECGTIPRCVIAAKTDLDNLYERWATVNNVPITPDFRDFEIEVGPFPVDVPAGHGLKREKGLSLPQGKWDGVAHGTYLLLENFQTGTYNIKFGGKATNYRTASEYTMTVR
jgi:hypothetical protein